MTMHPDGTPHLEDEIGDHDGHHHEDERAIPTLVKVGVLIIVALASVWIGWMLR